MITKIENNDISKALASKRALVDFSATWCGPCRMLHPVLEELSEELSGQVDFFNADCDENGELAAQYGIASIPALLLFENGKPVRQTVGFQPKAALKAFLGA